MTQTDQDRARVATQNIYKVGLTIVGISSPVYDAKASTRALINQETMAAMTDTLSEQGNAFKPDRFDAILATRLEALLAQLQALANTVTPTESGEDTPTPSVPAVEPYARNPGPPPPPPGQLPNPYLDEFALATPAIPGTLPADSI